MRERGKKKDLDLLGGKEGGIFEMLEDRGKVIRTCIKNMFSI